MPFDSITSMDWTACRGVPGSAGCKCNEATQGSAGEAAAFISPGIMRCLRPAASAGIAQFDQTLLASRVRRWNRSKVGGQFIRLKGLDLHREQADGWETE